MYVRKRLYISTASLKGIACVLQNWRERLASVEPGEDSHWKDGVLEHDNRVRPWHNPFTHCITVDHKISQPRSPSVRFALVFIGPFAS